MRVIGVIFLGIIGANALFFGTLALIHVFRRKKK
jgi:hypothetical protein